MGCFFWGGRELKKIEIKNVVFFVFSIKRMENFGLVAACFFRTIPNLDCVVLILFLCQTWQKQTYQKKIMIFRLQWIHLWVVLFCCHYRFLLWFNFFKKKKDWSQFYRWQVFSRFAVIIMVDHSRFDFIPFYSCIVEGDAREEEDHGIPQ